MSNSSSTMNPSDLILPEESGWDRIKKVFSPTRYESLSPEMRAILGATGSGAIFGIFVGTFVHSRNEYVEFMSKNMASQFSSHLEAKDLMGKRQNIALGRGAIIWGVRGAALGFCWTTLTGLISAYRGQRSYFECSIGGVATGALAGYFSRNFDALGVHSFTKRTLIFGSRFSPIYCAFVGLLIANAIAIICYSDETVLQQARKWERYWNEYDARKSDEKSGVAEKIEKSTK